MNFFLPQRSVPVRSAHLHYALGKERKNQTTTTNNQTKSTKFISGLDPDRFPISPFASNFQLFGSTNPIVVSKMQP
jgi:hypothetical protein